MTNEEGKTGQPPEEKGLGGRQEGAQVQVGPAEANKRMGISMRPLLPGCLA